MNITVQATKPLLPQKKGSKVQNNSSKLSQSTSVAKRVRTRRNPNSGDIPLNSGYNTRNRFQSTSTFRQTRREFIGSISTPALDFVLWEKFRINPASAKTFPWLSTIARNYERYKFHRCRFHFVHRENATVSGMLTFAPDYDGADNPPTSEQIANAYVDTCEGAPFRDLFLNLNVKSMERSYKTFSCMDDGRFDSTSQDKKTIDCAQVFVFTDADASDQKWGQLWVEYDVEFFQPQPPSIDAAEGGGPIVVGLATTSGLNPCIIAAPSQTPTSQQLDFSLQTIVDALTPGQKTTMITLNLTHGYSYPTSLLARVREPIRAYLSNLCVLVGLVSFVTSPKLTVVRPTGGYFDLELLFTNVISANKGFVGVAVRDPAISDTAPLEEGCVICMTAGTWTGTSTSTNFHAVIAGVDTFPV